MVTWHHWEIPLGPLGKILTQTLSNSIRPIKVTLVPLLPVLSLYQVQSLCLCSAIFRSYQSRQINFPHCLDDLRTAVDALSGGDKGTPGVIDEEEDWGNTPLEGEYDFTNNNNLLGWVSFLFMSPTDAVTAQYGVGSIWLHESPQHCHIFDFIHHHILPLLRSELVTPQMLERVKSSNLILKKSFSRSIMSRTPTGKTELGTGSVQNHDCIYALVTKTTLNITSPLFPVPYPVSCSTCHCGEGES